MHQEALGTQRPPKRCILGLGAQGPQASTLAYCRVRLYVSLLMGRGPEQLARSMVRLVGGICFLDSSSSRTPEWKTERAVPGLWGFA